MRFNHTQSLLFSAGLLLVFLGIGFALSERKFLWNDEIFTQQTGIDAQSLGGLLKAQFPDGNKNPLFYVVQKAVCKAFGYHLPFYYPHELYSTRDLTAQIILRIPSNVYMSLALAMIVYFFMRFYSWGAACFALAVALATPMVWTYWAEARPYPLWFLLTTAQFLLFIHAARSPGIRKTRSFLAVHVLLALTSPASLIQISVVTLMLGIKARYTLKQLAAVWVLPMAVALVYYFVDKTATIKTYLFASNFFDAVMPERLFTDIVYALMAWVLPQKYKQGSWNLFFFPVYALITASAFVVLFVDIFTVNSEQGFFSRYLIYAAPADILMFSLAGLDLWQWSRPNRWICLNVSIVLAGLTLVRGLMTYRSILASALYLHTP